MSNTSIAPKDKFFKTMDSVVLYLFILGYVYLFVYLIPWIEILGKDWTDISNYTFRIEYLARGGEEQGITGFISLLFSEYIWKVILLGIGEFFQDYREGLYLVSYVALLLYALFTFKRVHFLLAIALMINPMFVDLIMGQIRIALAFPILLLAFHYRIYRRFSILLILIALFIHTATILFLGIYFLLKIIDYYTEHRSLYFVSLGLGVAMALFIKYGVIFLLSIVGDRRAAYADSYQSSSLTFSLPWLIIALLLTWKANFESKEERLITAFSVLMISLFFTVSALGLYGQRYVAISIPLIIIAIGFMPKHFRHWTWAYLFFYQFLQWKYRVVLTII